MALAIIRGSLGEFRRPYRTFPHDWAFTPEIVRRARAGETKEKIVADLRITRELFNRAMRNR